MSKISGSKAWLIQVLSMSGEMVIPVQVELVYLTHKSYLLGRIDHKGNDE